MTNLPANRCLVLLQRTDSHAGVPYAFWSLLWRKLRLNLGRFFL